MHANCQRDTITNAQQLKNASQLMVKLYGHAAETTSCFPAQLLSHYKMNPRKAVKGQAKTPSPNAGSSLKRAVPAALIAEDCYSGSTY